VISFQAAHGLRVDGIAGPRTLAALASPKLVLLPGAGYVAGGSGRVRVLQRRLARAGYPPGPIDGRYGPRTEAAVIRFQTAKRLRIDGIAGPQTLSHLHLIPDSPGQTRPQRAVHRRPRPVRPQATRAPARTTPAPARHVAYPTGSSSTGWLVPLVGLALALLAGLAWRTRRRHSAWGEANRPSPDLPRAPAPADSDHYPTAVRREQPPTDVKLHPVLKQPGDLAAAKSEQDERGYRGSGLHLGTLLVRQGDLDAAGRAHQHDTTHDVASDAMPRSGHTNARTAEVNLPTSPSPTPIPDQIPNPDPTTPNPPRILTPSPEEQHDSGDSAFDYALMLEKHGDEQGAIAAYQRADQLGHPAAATNLGVLLEQHGEPAAAAAAYRRAAERGDGDGAFNLALLLGEEGDQEGAIAAYERADELGHAAATTNLGMLLEQQGDPQAAEAAYRRAEQRGDSNGAFNLALLLGDHGDHPGAVAAYERADRLGHAIAATNLGVLLEQQGDPAAAEAAYRRAEQRGDAHGAFNVGVLLEETGDHVGALHAYQRAEQLGHPEIAEMARAAEIELGQHERPTRTGGSHDAC
jgi:TPR repeat protein